jgi:hypothetical protein
MLSKVDLFIYTDYLYGNLTNTIKILWVYFWQ